MASAESIEIAAVVDRFPEHIRKRFLKSTRSLEEIYVACRELPIVRVPGAPLPENVIEFRPARAG